ncbi:ABC transporter substrate-binding protein [Synechococcales cyanobacterium C]|uniref:ABC transporter substrate-binding protein n=1 Tax=Petrachloros mirabilis ULC683 TaxID=2781853 RepID=A0A8K2A840_9CYAN|nr:iron-siderophore ABC transporter substrate-binding protein [Petrachloros mirabilis]NCJ06834.1 ABC transporter substrate-binding protein [Petrachloros mirabilis ULC683]
MIDKIHHVIKGCFLSVLALILIVACSGKSPHNITAQDHISPSSVTRIVEHTMGKTIVPASPQRIVTINPLFLGNALALGIKPTGSTGWQLDDSSNLSAYEAYLQRLPGEFTYLGLVTQPSLEKILSVKPDLIVGFDSSKPIYGQLSQIAPTLLFSWSGTAQSWKETLLAFGEAIGKSQEANEALEAYYQRTQEFKQNMGEKAAQTQVSLIELDSNNTISLIPKDVFAGSILEDAGLSRPSSQNWTRGYQIISLEQLPQIDGDVIFIRTSGDNDQERAQLVKQLQSHVLWSQLNAVRQGKVYQIDPYYWFNSSIIDANLVLDDLSKYILEE